MKIICSGMPKTGTKSLSAALRILGYNVYDFEEQHYYLGPAMTKATREGLTIEEFRNTFENIDTFTDVPACVFFEELHEAFPDAKVIHCERSSEDEWCRSSLKQADEIHGHKLLRIMSTLTPGGRYFQDFLNNSVRAQFSAPPFPGIFGQLTKNPTLAVLRYRQHNTRVRQVIPKDKLLIYNVREGWEPLCKFLGVPIPSQSFPHRNKGGKIVYEIVDKSYIFEDTKRQFFIVLCLLTLALAMLIYYFMF